MRHKRFKIRGTPLNEHPFSKTSLLKLFKDVAGVTPNDIKQEGTDILFFFYSEEEVDKLLSYSANFSNQHLRLNFPRQYLAEHSVVIHDLSQWIVEQDDADDSAFMHDFKASNPDLRLHQAQFFNSSRSLKLTFETVASATLATRNGVYSFGIHIPPFRVKMERFHIVNQCLRCYEYTHSTSKCTQRIQKCSLCSADHHYSICKSETLCCLLCKGDHPAISIHCPHRQNAIKNMEKSTSSTGASTSEATSQSATTSTSGFNAQAAIFPELPGGRPTATTSQWGASSQTPTSDSSSQPSPPAQPKTKLIGQSTVKALISTARITAGNNPREFVRLLKILYKANGLPTFIVPEEVFNAPRSSPTTDPVEEDADSTSDDDDSATAMQPSDPVRVPTAHKTLPHVTPTSASVPVTNHDITVNAATLSDILSAPAPHASPAAAVPSPVSVANFAAIDPWCDPIEGTDYAAPSAAVPTAVTHPPRTLPSRHQPSRTQPSRNLPQRVNTPAPHSSDESDEDVSVGTPSPPRKDHLQASTRTVTTKTDKPKKKNNDQSLVKSTRKKTPNELT